jgi:hypothetical protein
MPSRNESTFLQIIFAETESGAGQSPAWPCGVTPVWPRLQLLVSKIMANPTEERIRTRAHQLWEIAGRPEGRDEEFWLEAERELKEGAANNPDEKSKTFLE